MYVKKGNKKRGRMLSKKEKNERKEGNVKKEKYNIFKIR
jgi:hypothetical protein